MSQPPNPYYGPPRPPQYGPPPNDDKERAKTGLFRAGQVAVWVWVVLTILIILVPIACCGFCGLGGLVGAASDPSTTP